MLASAMAKPGSTLALTQARVREVIALIPTGVAEAITGAPHFLFRDATAAFSTPSADTAVGHEHTGHRTTVAVARALGLGVGLTMLCALLLSGGDPVFRSVVAWPSEWEVLTVPDYVIRFVLFGASAIALLSSTTRPAADHAEWMAPAPTLNRLDTLTVLGSLNGLFAAYLLLQVRVLFGGSAYVLQTTGLTLAQYARDGFFALTCAAGLVLGVLLTLNALLRDDRLGVWQVSRRLSTSLVIMVGLMLASAAARMLLYVQSFGISIDRLIALAIMAWVAMTGAWFLLTVLRERSSRFVIGAVVAASATLVTLNVINPEAIVVRSAVARAGTGGTLDVDYLQRELRSDAVPALVEALRDGALPTAPMAIGTRSAACVMATALLDQWRGAATNPWTSWTLSETRAVWTVAANGSLLRAQCDR
jgi:hypothetical protein